MHVHRSWRLEPIEKGGNLALRAVGNLLSHNFPLGRDTDDDATSLAIEKRAMGLTGAVELPGRFLQLQRLRLTSGDLAPYGSEVHVHSRLRLEMP